jgi:DNA-binding beta-propeller fold protein YncE
MKKITLPLMCVCSIAVSFSGQAQSPGMHVIDSFPIPGAARWDYIAVGPVKDWLYVSHGTKVNVINKKNGDSVAVIDNTTGVHGIAFAPEAKKGFTSNGKLNTVTVFDMNTNKVLGQIATGKDPDDIFYDSYSKKIITCNGDNEGLSIIDPVTERVVDSVDLGGSPEAGVSDGAGKLFVNLEDKSEIVEVDARSFKVLAHWSLAPGISPTGLSMDRKTKKLFSGCQNGLMVMDAVTGKVVDSLPIGKGCDGTAFDPGTDMVFASCGDGTMTAIQEGPHGKFTVVQTIPTKRGARTLSLDETTHLIYLPTAQFAPMQPGQTGRPKAIDGTFQVLMVGK